MQKKIIPEWISVGMLSERTGVSVSALHFYERKGLIKSHRNASNHRLYPKHVIRIVSLILVAQRTGFSLEDILSELAGLPNRTRVTLEDWEQLGSRWQSELDKKITQLTELRDMMTDCIGCGCLSLERCRLLNPYDELGEKGAGPRLMTE
ncbi:MULTISPECIES: redox-sensitive transcriptional activator SoxR [Marinomonas]|uniref:Redox-sensitive transcriptional activator SoxR n=1 Tax=Marinomonas arctica TaxID=383750 RepID=A0A7H1JAS9_9GAMM|nr:MULTISPECIES: redox-sensitive transcriptional activator SoxR [Marinomonas]MCS7486895.1 transcriptional regulator [Marinomonas sp. BSi20414]QNT07595.1 redox-sensitive transcriptional activator SoxR [Marinomonas arctica]GGN21137.1 redox-sensitive transcriptional activator SoxR [Marinomonas arctica]